MDPAEGDRHGLTVGHAKSSEALRWLGHPEVTVLGADSDPGSFGEVEDLCAHNGARFVPCDNGAEVLFQVGRLDPAAVVMRAESSVVTAPDLITTVRQHTSVPIAVGLRTGEAHRAASVLAAGATRIVGYPYRRRDLQPLLGDVFALAKARADDEAVIQLGTLRLSSVAYEVELRGRPIQLTLREFELLRFLMLHTDRVLTVDQIRAGVWGPYGKDVTANTVAAYVGRLRAALGEDIQLSRVRGVGYRLVPPRRRSWDRRQW